MLECQQFPGMNVYEHGVSVHEWFKDLMGAQERPWRLPKWVPEIQAMIDPAQMEEIRLYQTFHDCGKPYCKEVDEQGRVHFPDHAAVSERIWMEHSDGSESDRRIGRLIGMDMLAHTVKGEAIDQFVQLPEAPILILTALAEIHSNASHLNALDSDSFKIKLKQIDKLGKRFLQRAPVAQLVQSVGL
jgi:hypothetical protein